MALTLVALAVALAAAGTLHVSLGGTTHSDRAQLAPLLRVAPGSVPSAPAAPAPSAKLPFQQLTKTFAYGSVTLTRAAGANYLLRTAVVVPPGPSVVRLVAPGRAPLALSRSAMGGAQVQIVPLSERTLRRYRFLEVTRGRTLLRTDLRDLLALARR